MASYIVVGFTSDIMEHIDVEADISSCYSVVNGYEPSFSNLISSTGSIEESTNDAIEYCLCNKSDEEAFIECRVCGSFIEPSIYNPLFYDIPIAEE